MKRNLQVKFLIIVGVILICLYGIIGIPKNKAELVENWHKNIRLGLDLRGGSHLVIQVQEQDAFNADAGTAADRLKEEAKKAGVTIADTEVQEAKSLQEAGKVAIRVKGVPSTQAGQFRALVNDQFTQWVLTGLDANDYRLTVKPSSAIQMRQEILSQTRSTIEKKINALGLSESSVQQRRGDAEAELLVQLPGVDDPARIKQILQTAAVLELYAVQGGPYPTKEAALAQSGGVMAPGTKLVGSNLSDAQGGRSSGGWYSVTRTPVVRGPDIRDARSSQDSGTGGWDTNFVLSQDAARRFERYTGANVGNRLAIVLDGKWF